jgi:alpha-beta hydrolase superfamily lysophospholipase
VTKVGAKDQLFGAQTLRVMGAAPYGGADVGECLATLARVRGSDLTSWYDAWSATATRVLRLAEQEEATGREESARLAFFRASGYFRTAGSMLLGAPLDERVVDSNRRQTAAFRRGAQLLAMPPEQLEIPYGQTSLPGYLFRVNDNPTPRPLVILVGGYDGTAEELYFSNGAAALARGYHVLAFDGPGQGAALLQRRLVMRADWDQVVTPVLDFALRQPGVDAERVALIGLSLGGFLAPRAASVEHRLAACIADCGSYDLFEAALRRMPPPLAVGFMQGRPRATAILRAILGRLQHRPTAGWALRRGMLVHGAADPIEYLEMTREYTLKRHAARITCPTFVGNAEGDDISICAPQLYDALTCPKEFVTFTAADGAGDHCESGARTLYHARSFGWLDALLQPVVPRSVLSGHDRR